MRTKIRWAHLTSPRGEGLQGFWVFAEGQNAPLNERPFQTQHAATAAAPLLVVNRHVDTTQIEAAVTVTFRGTCRESIIEELMDLVDRCGYINSVEVRRG